MDKHKIVTGTEALDEIIEVLERPTLTSGAREILHVQFMRVYREVKRDDPDVGGTYWRWWRGYRGLD